jgi:Uma2 family endonuclease
MVAQLQGDQLPMTPAEYLEWEAQQDSKFEYEDGSILAMTGGTLPHSQISANFAALLIPQLRGKRCKVAVSDAKVAIPSGKYYYPDLLVTCDERDRTAREDVHYPCLVVEVLSPATEARDRGIKQQSYMMIPTLNTYILVDPDQPKVETYQRQQATWEYTFTASIDLRTLDPLIQIANLEIEFPLSALYENVDFSWS